MLSLFVPVHVKSLLKVQFIQILLKITSIVPNLTFKGHPRSKVIEFKDHEVNYYKGHPRSKVMRSTEIPYMTYYMCSYKLWS